LTPKAFGVFSGVDSLEKIKNGRKMACATASGFFRLELPGIEFILQ
jgi:hypothetical protein